MPFRIACPSCSATLNLKDELAGRAVKCPRCGDTVPATATAPRPPAAAAFEVVEDDAPPAPVPPPKPAATTPPLAAEVLPEEDDEVEVPRKGRGAKPAGGKRNKLIVLGLVGYWAFAVFASFWLNYRGTNRINAPGIGLGSGATTGDTGGKKSAAAQGPGTRANYDKLRLKMTRAEVEAILGPGRVLGVGETPADVAGKFGASMWIEKTSKGRVLVWESGQEQLQLCMYPDTGPAALVQGRRFFHDPKEMYSFQEGAFDDEKFARDNGLPLNGPPSDDPKTALRVTAAELSKAYAADPKAAGFKYDARWLVVAGAVRESEPNGTNGLMAVLDGTPPVRCRVKPFDEAGARSFAHGKEVRFRGRCLGLKDSAVELSDCTLESGGAAPAAANIVTMMLDYGRDPTAADAKYKDKSFRLTDAVVESVNDDNSVTLVSPKKTQALYKVKVAFGPAWKGRLEGVKPGDKLPLAGFCKGLAGKVVEFERAWLLAAP